MNIDRLIKFLIYIVTMSAFGIASAQERKMEEVLVYSDPTVSKQESWSGGMSLDAFRTTVGTKEFDTQGGEHDATSTSTRVGFSGYVGKGDTSFLLSYRPSKANITVPAGGDMISEDRIEAKTGVVEALFRYLDRSSGATWYVPYYLGGISTIKEEWVVSTVVVNGITEQQTTKGTLLVLGAGAIIPITSKYGYRVDARWAVGRMQRRSNLFVQLNDDYRGSYFRPSATAYYNLTEDVNVQAGLQYDTFLKGAGAFLQLGMKF